MWRGSSRRLRRVLISWERERKEVDFSCRYARGVPLTYSLSPFMLHTSMADDVDLQPEILRKTLEAAHEIEKDATPCVICLEAISEAAIAVPCGHSFDFLCLLSWLEQRHVCPLCELLLSLVSFCLMFFYLLWGTCFLTESLTGKSVVTAVQYELTSASTSTNQPFKLYQLPSHRDGEQGQLREAAVSLTAASDSLRNAQLRRRRRRLIPHANPSVADSTTATAVHGPDGALARRRHVYRHQLYSLRVGSNRLSRYRELTPESFNRDEELVSRARKWIRRELEVFAFLRREDVDDDGAGRPGASDCVSRTDSRRRLQSRRANNAEFLLEYIIAILRTVEIKGSAGQAEELLRDFLGRDNARLFLHELQAWLRSPYTSLQDWDRHVQYEDTFSPSPPPPSYSSSSPGPGLELSSSSLSYSPRLRRPRQMSSTRAASDRSPSLDERARYRRVRRAMERYVPD